MEKLMTCAMKWGQSTPNALAVSAAMPANMIWFIKSFWKSPGRSELRTGQLYLLASGPFCRRGEDREKHDTCRKGNGQDRLDKDLRGGAGIASHRFGSLGSNETHTDSGPQGRETDVNIAGHFCQHWH